MRFKNENFQLQPLCIEGRFCEIFNELKAIHVKGSLILWFHLHVYSLASNFVDLVETVSRICNFVDNDPITKYH